MSAAGFMSDFTATTHPNPLVRGERYYHLKVDGAPTVVMVKLYEQNGGIYLDGIRTPPEAQGKGAASWVMGELVKLANKHGVYMTLYAKPFGEHGLPFDRLVRWYNKFGFVRAGAPFDSEGDGNVGQDMERKPTGRLTLDAGTRNPSSAGYNQYLGSGSFSVAKFNKHAESEPVEIITTAKSGRVDASKDVLMEARRILIENGDHEAAAHLPLLRRKRMDDDGHGNTEFIYASPRYRWADWPDEARLAPSVQRAVDVIGAVADSVSKTWFWDWGQPNTAADDGGNFILLDPLACMVSVGKLKKLWATVAVKNPAPAATRSSAVENGVQFQTGVPVSFPFMHNTERAPKPPPGDPFEQRVEPAGFYCIHDTAGSAGRPEFSHWTSGMMRFESPLVVELGEYGKPSSWKRRLADHYGATGIRLSRKIRADGFDGIVTVDGAFSAEIVDLSSSKRNPPSPGFDPLDFGARAQAYVNRATGRVELAIGPRAFYGQHPAWNDYDLSREILVEARKIATPAGRKHLPDVRRERVDWDDVPVQDIKTGETVDTRKALHFVYSMPFYEGWDENHLELVENLEYAFGDEPQRSEQWKRLPKGIRDAIVAIEKAGAAMGVPTRSAWDAARDNFSASNGALVLRDPLGIDGKKQDLAALWERNGGPAIPVTATRNPPSLGYADKLGQGSYTAAWAKGDEVELIVSQDGRWFGTGAIPPGMSTIEASKDVIIAARDALAEDPDALAYLPVMIRKRIDRGAKGQLEFVWATTKYRTDEDTDLWRTQMREQYGPKRKWNAVWILGGTHIADTTKRMVDDLADSEAPDELVRAIRALLHAAKALCKKYGVPVNDAGWDLHRGNVALDKAGHLVLLDPLWLYVHPSKLAAEWRKLGIPEVKK